MHSLYMIIWENEQIIYKESDVKINESYESYVETNESCERIMCENESYVKT